MNIDDMLKGADLRDRADRNELADALLDCGRGEEAGLLAGEARLALHRGVVRPATTEDLARAIGAELDRLEYDADALALPDLPEGYVEVAGFVAPALAVLEALEDIGGPGEDAAEALRVRGAVAEALDGLAVEFAEAWPEGLLNVILVGDDHAVLSLRCNGGTRYAAGYQGDGVAAILGEWMDSFDGFAASAEEAAAWLAERDEDLDDFDDYDEEDWRGDEDEDDELNWEFLDQLDQSGDD